MKQKEEEKTGWLFKDRSVEFYMHHLPLFSRYCLLFKLLSASPIAGTSHQLHLKKNLHTLIAALHSL